MNPPSPRLGKGDGNNNDEEGWPANGSLYNTMGQHLHTLQHVGISLYPLLFFEIIAVKKVFNWNPLNWLNSLLEEKKVFGEKAKDEKSWRLKSKAGSWKGNAKF